MSRRRWSWTRVAEVGVGVVLADVVRDLSRWLWRRGRRPLLLGLLCVWGWLSVHTGSPLLALLILAVLFLSPLVGWKLARRERPIRPPSSWDGAPGIGRPTCVYRLFTTDGLFLYVGVAYSFEERMRGHANDPDERHWWWRVDMSAAVVEWFPTREQALASETAWITGANGGPRPLFNRSQNGAEV